MTDSETEGSPAPGGCVTAWAVAMLAFAVYYFVRTLLQLQADAPAPVVAGIAARGILCLGFGLLRWVRSEASRNRVFLITGIPCLGLFGYEAHARGGGAWTAFCLMAGIGVLLFIGVRLRMRLKSLKLDRKTRIR